MQTTAYRVLRIAFLVSLITPVSAQAQMPCMGWMGSATTDSTGGSMGPGMMGMGPRMMQNMGPMMGMCYGMMQNMGPGMMGGMMNACPMMGMMGMGAGMMGANPTTAPTQGAAAQPPELDLSDAQQKRINSIRDDERKQHWEIMGKMMDQQARLRDLNLTPTPDPKKVGAVYADLGKLQQQMAEMHVKANNQVYAVLTEEQKNRYLKWRQGGKP